MDWTLIITITIFVLLFILLIICIYTKPAKLDSNVYDYLKPNEYYDIIKDNGSLIFKPKSTIKSALDFYQGGLVDAKGYVYLSELTKSGIMVIIEDFFLNFAFFDQNRINKRMKEYPSINNWYLGGHSLGGAMACRYASSNPNKLKGLILLGSYSDKLIKNVKVLSIYGSLEDESFKTRSKNLPEDTVFVSVEGGNHTNFGMYELQSGDVPSTSTKKFQQDVVIDEIKKFILA
jgi:hypothetical protein